MEVVTEFPHKVRVVDPAFITLADGVRLAARVWMPEDAEGSPVPAILEYLPYRRGDGTSERDCLTHPYFAGHGYACVRIDMRGSGDSEGLLLGEYLRQEQDDALEVIDWIVSQPWCDGNVGIIGISWGGFNGLQIAARRPPALKAVVSICSTDDRYADDIHYMGGCLLNDNAAWNAYMFSLNTTPPDPAVVGERWREMWLDRLKGSGFWLKDWLEHQRRDGFYKHGSVCENFADIETAVYAVGGWADGYTNTVFRLLEGLQSPCKGLVGPWAHKYPHFARPGPAIGFLQECLRWWDHWLKGKDTGVMGEPRLRCWIEDPAPPATRCEERPGRWVAEDGWPSGRTEARAWHLNRDGLAEDAGGRADLRVCSPMTVGMMAGQWCPHGVDPDLPGDQRLEAGGSLVFDSPPLPGPLDCLGMPVAELELAADRPSAMVAVCLSEILPDGAATRVSFGLLNLTHRDSHESPEPMEPGKPCRIRVALNAVGHRFGAGNRIRVAISGTYWPMAWPSPERVTLTVTAGESRLVLPVRLPSPEDAKLAPFAPPQGAAPLDRTMAAEPAHEWEHRIDMATGTVTERLRVDEGETVYNGRDGWSVASTHEELKSVSPDDPLSARVELRWTEKFGRAGWGVSSSTKTVMTSTATHFLVDAELEAREGGEVVHTDRWRLEFGRDHV